METSARHVVIVGASLGGLRTAEELRSAGFDGRITLVGAEQHRPYDRPPLSKQMLADAWEPDRLKLMEDAALDALELELVLGERATELDVTGRRVTLGSGAVLQYDIVVISTGVSARTLPTQPKHPAVHVVRTVEDSLALRRSLSTSRSLLVVGGGFIGAEVAAVARHAGLEVSIVEGLDVPFGRTLGTTVGAACARLHIDHGVQLHCGSGVKGFTTNGAAAGVHLENGTSLEADCVLVGIGTVANTQWLENSGLDISNGVACDGEGRAVGAQRVFAVGDVAAWLDVSTGRRTRVEHWTSATQQARVVAHAIMGQTAGIPTLPLPFFWSDQYRMKIQLLGHPGQSDEVRTLRGDVGQPTLFGYFNRERLVAMASFGAPRLLALSRPLIERHASCQDVEAAIAQWV